MRRTTRRGARAGLGLVGIVVLIAVILAAIGIGVLVAMSVTKQPRQPADAAEGKPTQDAFKYLTFGPTTVNLNEGRLTRYLQITVSLKLAPEHEPRARALLEGGEKALFNDWLITYLSDLTLDDVKGAPAIRALKREIYAGFNDIFAKLSEVEVIEVLIEDYVVQ